MVDATSAQIEKAVKDGIPDVATVFWAFRLMLGFWGIATLLIAIGLFFSLKGTVEKHRIYLRCVLYSIPLPYMAAEFGWVLAETGRQPWTVHLILPTFMSTSTISVGDLITSLSGFIIFYTTLFVVELFLMFKYARLGPSSLGTARYHFENKMMGE